MDNFITLYEQILDRKFCQHLIKIFENNSSFYEQKENTIIDSQWKMKFTQINFANHDLLKKENKTLRGIFLEAIAQYKKNHNIKSLQWPEKFKLEPIRMKRYRSNSDDRFDDHVDVNDHESARRFLVMFIYLNDNFEGGETEFSQHGVRVIPQQGSMILFPPLWTHPHKSSPVTGNNPKYIIGTYMHY